MAKEKCLSCGGKSGDGYHKDPEETCGVCGGTGEVEVTSQKLKKKN